MANEIANTIVRINSWIMVTIKRTAEPADVATKILNLNTIFANAGVGDQRTIVRADVVNNDRQNNSFQIMVPVIVMSEESNVEAHYSAVLEAIKGVDGVHKIDPYRVELVGDHNPTDPDKGKNKPPGASAAGDNTWG